MEVEIIKNHPETLTKKKSFIFHPKQYNFFKIPLLTGFQYEKKYSKLFVVLRFDLFKTMTKTFMYVMSSSQCVENREN